LLAGATSAWGAISAPIEKAKTTIEITGANSQRNLPGPLVLKSSSSVHQLAMQHDSHSSHVSHASHGSHGSHGSHSSHSSGL
jgi:hypothetical protein